MDLTELNQLDDPFYKEGTECPNCSGTLVARYRRDFEGKEFLGCSNPKCNFTA